MLQPFWLFFVRAAYSCRAGCGVGAGLMDAGRKIKTAGGCAACGFALSYVTPRRDLPEAGPTILPVNTLGFLKIMDVPFLHTRKLQCSSYIYNAKVAIIV